MTQIYARDLREDLQTDAFMGEGFEKALEEADKKGEDLVIGEFDDSWKEGQKILPADEVKTSEEPIKIKVGDTFYTSWGYDQTNYDFIIVTSISPTRKTAMCKLSKVEHIRSEAQAHVQKPKAEGYGFEFRMRIEKDENGNETGLRGSYPYCASEVARGVEAKDCGYRLDTFNKTKDNDEYWETDTMFGH